MGWPHATWTLAGYGARGSSEIIGFRLELLEELMDAIRHITLFAEGYKGTGMQVLLVSANMSGQPSISGEKENQPPQRL